METSDAFELILTYFEIGLTFFTIIISALLVIWQLKKNRKLETIKYLFTVRKEIWDLDEESKLTKSSKKQIGQNLEYMAAAINNDDLSIKLIKNFCGRWFQGAVRITGIIDDKKKENDNESYEEIEKLYKKLNESYNNN